MTHPLLACSKSCPKTPDHPSIHPYARKTKPATHSFKCTLNILHAIAYAIPHNLGFRKD